MNLRRNARILLVLLALASLASCRKPALLVLDPATEAYLAIQGVQSGRLANAAGAAGYHLSVLSLKPDEPFAAQVERAIAGLGNRQAPLLFAPMLRREAEGLEKLGYGARVRVFEPRRADRQAAYARLGRLAAAFVLRSPERRIQLCVQEGDRERQAEADAFGQGFRAASGPAGRLSLQTLPAAADEAAVHALAALLRSPVPALTVLATGPHDRELISFMGDWPGHFAAPDLAGFGHGLPGAVATMEYPWEEEFGALLAGAGKPAGKPEPASPNAALVLLNEYLDK